MFTWKDDSNVTHEYCGLRYMTPAERQQAKKLHSVNFYIEGTPDDTVSYREFNSYGDFHLIPETMPFIVPPPVKLLTVDVPGSTTGEVDMSESLTGAPLYGVREGTLEFMYENSYRHATQMHGGIGGPYIASTHTVETHQMDTLMSVSENVRGGTNTPSFLGPNGTHLGNDPHLVLPNKSWVDPLTNCRYFYKDGYITPFRIYELLMKTIHGRRARVVLMDFPDYYYEGRVWVETMTPGQISAGKVTIKYRFSPYRYQVARGGENGTAHGMVSYDGVPIFDPRTNFPGYVYMINKTEGDKPIAIL